MECQQIQERLSAYLEGSLPPAEKALIEQHLKPCQRCQEALADLRKTIEVVQGLPEVEPPAWLTQRVMARVRSEAAPRKTIWEKLFYPIPVKLPLEAAGVIAIAVVTIYVFKGIQPEMHLGKAPLEGMRGPTISEVKRPAVPPSSMPEGKTQEKEKAIWGKGIEPKPTQPPEQPMSQGRKEAPAPSPAPSPAPALRFDRTAPSVGKGERAEPRREVLSDKEEAGSGFDLAKPRDELKSGARPAAPQPEALAKKPAGQPATQGQQGAQAPVPAERENRAMSSVGAIVKDESRPESLSAAPRGGEAHEERAKEKSDRQALSAAPAAKALAEKKQAVIHLTLAVRDLDAAVPAIEKALSQLGGRIIKMETTEGKIVLSAELSSNQVRRLLDRLRDLGELKGGTADSAAEEGATETIRIEALRAQ